MTGYKLDPDELESAIKELQDLLFSVNDLRGKSAFMVPGELRAGDRNTRNAYEAFKDLAISDQNSFRSEMDKIRQLLEQRIDSYKSALAEYKKAEDNASIDTSKIQREA